MKSYYITINVETIKNRIKKMTTMHWIKVEIIIIISHSQAIIMNMSQSDDNYCGIINLKKENNKKIQKCIKESDKLYYIISNILAII